MTYSITQAYLDNTGIMLIYHAIKVRSQVFKFVVNLASFLSKPSKIKKKLPKFSRCVFLNTDQNEPTPAYEGKSQIWTLSTTLNLTWNFIFKSCDLIRSIKTSYLNVKHVLKFKIKLKLQKKMVAHAFHWKTDRVYFHYRVAVRWSYIAVHGSSMQNWILSFPVKCLLKWWRNHSAYFYQIHESRNNFYAVSYGKPLVLCKNIRREIASLPYIFSTVVFFIYYT